MASEQNDILAQFIENERSAKKWTLVSVAIFVGLAFCFLYLMSELKKAKDETEAAKDATDRALARADSINGVLESFKTSQANIEKAAISKPAPVGKKENKPVASVLRPDVRKTSSRKKEIIVFIQYKKEYRDQCRAVAMALREDKYLVPGRELIEKINFSSSVKYFNDSDEIWADSVAQILNRTLGRNESNKVPVVRDYLNAPKGQLEVWMGDYRAPATSELVRKYSSPKNLEHKN